MNTNKSPKKNTIVVYSIKVDGANPNGDPRNNNSPRMTDDGYGIIVQFCLKHKLRNLLAALGEKVYMIDDDVNLTTKVQKLVDASNIDKNDGDKIAELLRNTYIDIRMFGSMTQTVKIKGSNGKDVNVGRAVAKPAVTFSSARSLKPINPYSYGITSCIPLKEKTSEHGCSTMGSGCDMVFNSTYVGSLAINSKVCLVNGVTEYDIDEKLIKPFSTMFVGDESSARPLGTMKVDRMIRIDYDGSEGIDPYDIRKDYESCFDLEGNLDENKVKTLHENLHVEILK